MKKSAFIFMHSLVVLSSAGYSTNCYDHNPDNIHFNNVVLEVDGNCETNANKITQANDGFDAQDLVGLGVAIAGNVVPGGWAVYVAYNFITGLGSDSVRIGDALDDMYEDLIRCMDSKLNHYRSHDLESKWRGLMETFEDHLGLLAAGGSEDEVRELVKELWKNDMNTAINHDFSQTILEQQYLTAEALLPITKLVGEVYWLTYTVYLGMLKRKIDSGDYHDLTEPTLQEAISTYNYDVDLGRKKFETLKSWSHNAIDVINVMYAPTPKFSTPMEWEWEIKWEKEEKTKSGHECTGYWCGAGTGCDWNPFGGCSSPCGGVNCGSCWENIIMDEFNGYINDLTTDYVDLIDILSRNSYLIGDYGQISYYQVTPQGRWYHCTANKEGANSIQDAILKCNDDSDCIGFSWSDELQTAVLKSMLNCEDGGGLGTGSHTSIWKETSPLCYQQVLTAEYPVCPLDAPDVTRQWADGSETYFRVQCDSNPDCIGYVWDPITSYGSLRTVECISYGMKKESVFNLYAKCLKLEIEYSSEPIATVDAVTEIQLAYDGKCLDLDRSNNKVITWSCHGGTNQQWTYDLETKALKLKDNGKCLDLDQDNNKAITWACHGGTNQQWLYNTQTKRLKTVCNNKCLGVSFRIDALKRTVVKTGYPISVCGLESDELISQEWNFINNNVFYSNVNTFIFIGSIAICCLCSFIGVCIRFIGSNKQYDLRYKVVAMETADDCRQSEEDYI